MLVGVQQNNPVKTHPKTLQVFPTAEHTRFQHSLAVGQLARSFGYNLSRNVRQGAVGDLIANECKATREELMQLELAGYAHDLGHGPFSHLWEKFMQVAPGSKWQQWYASDGAITAASSS
jgi:deoxynucleoside triphosphate triphosphohydrolase SAMHD1